MVNTNFQQNEMKEWSSQCQVEEKKKNNDTVT